MVAAPTILKEKVWAILESVMDPEIPVLSIIDLGIVKDIKANESNISISITPTYSGCPAMDMIATNIKIELLAHGYRNIDVIQVLSPVWTTDWMSEAGKKKLKEYGIAAPNPRQQVCSNELFAANGAVQCPRCNSYRTHRISEFGSTACKSLHQCDDCKEPFDYFKCH